MRKQVLFGAVLATALLVSACSQGPAEVEGGLEPQFGTSKDDSGSYVALDEARGAVYLLGETLGSLGGKNLGGQDSFLRRYTRSGTLIWARQFGSGANDFNKDLAVDTNRGSVYVLRERGDRNRAFLYKFDPNGRELWKSKIVYKGNENVTNTQMTADRSGAVYLAGNVGSEKAFVQKLDSAGRLLWAKEFGTLADYFYTSAIAVDDNRNVYLATQEVSPSQGDIYTLFTKVSSSGATLYRQKNPTSYIQYPADMTVTGGAIYLTGRREGYEYLDKLTLDGRRVWSNEINSSVELALYALAPAGNGNVLLAGSRYLYDSDAEVEHTDALLQKYDARGRLVWSQNYNSQGFEYDSAYGVVAHTSGELYVTGATDGSLGDGTNRGGRDAFLRRTDKVGTPVWTD